MTFSSSDWKLIEPYVDKALELDDTARAAWLSDLALTDAPLAEEVGKFLAEGAGLKAQGFLESGITGISGDAQLVGARIGNYTLQERVGQGGMGTVWLALRSDGRFEGRAAVKLLNSALVGRPAELRFAREGSLLANLKHPHIAQLIDAGAAESGQAYLILEYVDGRRIDEYCEQRSLTIEQRVRLYLDVLAAVAFAHSHLIVHRDIKPSNIMVTDDGAVKLLDFGIAGLLATDGRAGGALTLEAGSALTPEYAAPEQLLNQPVTTATDVYALGLVLFVLLAGRHPIAAADTSVLRRIIATTESESPRLSQIAAGTALERTLRGDLDNILAKALKLNPLERYATVDAFADDLRRFLAKEPVKARPDSIAYRAGKFIDRHRIGVITASAAAVGLMALSVFAWVQMREARLQRDAAFFETKRAEQQAAFATQMLGAVGDGDQIMTRSQILENGLHLLDRQYADDLPFVVHTLINMSGRFMDIGDTKKEYAALVKAERLARRTGDPVLLAAVQCNTVETEIAAGRLDQAVARLRDGQAALARAANASVGDHADCLYAEAKVAESRNDAARSVAIVLQAIEMLERAGPVEMRKLRYTGLLSQLSGFYDTLGRDAEALQTDERSLRILEEQGQKSSQSALATMHNIAVGREALGEIRDSLAMEAIVVQREQSQYNSGLIHPATSAAYGGLLVRMGETADGLSWLDRAVNDAHAQQSLMFEAKIRLRRAQALLSVNRIEAAGKDLDDVDRMIRGDRPSFSRLIPRLAVIRSEYFLASNKPELARALIEPLEKALPRPLGAGDGADEQRTIATAARVALGGGRAADAARLAEEALALARRKARKPGSSADVGEAYLLQSKALRMNGAIDAARKSAQQAAAALAGGLGPNHALTLEAEALAR